MSHHNGHGNGHRKQKGDQSLPEKVSFGKNGSIPEGYNVSKSGPQFIAIGTLLLTGLLGCGLITFIVLFFL